MKASRRMLVLFLAPAILSYAFIYVYPTLQTIYFSFNRVTAFAGGTIEFRGLRNYTELLRNPLFLDTFRVFLKWWLVGGVALFGGAFLFTLLFMSGIRFKRFWRIVLYGPNIYRLAFGTTGEGTGEFALGKAAAGACLLLMLVIVVAALISQLLKQRKEVEY